MTLQQTSYRINLERQLYPFCVEMPKVCLASQLPNAGKLKDPLYHMATRLACSDNSPTDINSADLSALQDQHPSPHPYNSAIHPIAPNLSLLTVTRVL